VSPLVGLFVVLFLVVGALLPRPFSETPLWNPTRAITQDRKASQYAVNRDSAGKGEGRSGENATKGDGQATGKGGEPGAKGKDGEAKKGSGEKEGKNGSGDEKGGNNPGEKGEKSQAKGEQGKESKDSGREAKSEEKTANKDGSNSAERLQNTSVGSALSKVANVLKWLVFVALALIVLFVVFRHGLQFLSNFMPWAKNLLAAIDAWLKGLFGGKDKEVKEQAAATTLEPVESHVPFTAFTNPFADGTASRRPPEELVRYSFEALEAWAGDRDADRRSDETALEFADRLGKQFGWLHEDARRLALLVARLAYAGGRLPAHTMNTLDHFWDRITGGPIDDDEVDAAEIVDAAE